MEKLPMIIYIGIVIIVGALGFLSGMVYEHFENIKYDEEDWE